MTKQIVLVTGAASGLGRATATHFAKHGAHVVLCDLATSAGSQVASELGPTCVFQATDVTKENDVTAALDLAEAAFGEPVNVVVNCAGVIRMFLTFDEESGAHPLAPFQECINVNTVGTFNVIRLAAERMAKRDADEHGERGVIINTSSVGAFDGIMASTAYAASKAAIAGMTLPLANDLAQFGIRVNTLAPGLFDTPMLEELPDRIKNEIVKTVPFPCRRGTPEEFAQMVQVIIDNKMLNGTTIRVDGALRLPRK